MCDAVAMKGRSSFPLVTATSKHRNMTVSYDSIQLFGRSARTGGDGQAGNRLDSFFCSTQKDEVNEDLLGFFKA